MDITGFEIEKFIEKIANQLVDQALILIEKPHEEIGLLKTEEVQIIKKTELQKYQPGEVIICPSQPDGVDFLRKYNAWGYVNIASNRNPKYFALYVSAPISKILYFGEIDSITEPLKSEEDLEGIMEDDRITFQKGKRVIFLKTNSIIELSNPILLGDNLSALRSLRCSTLKNLISAKTIDDI